MGKSQTYLPWESWQRPYIDRAPTIWFHDVFYKDGKPYRQREVEIIHSLLQGRRNQSSYSRLQAQTAAILHRNLCNLAPHFPMREGCAGG